MSEAITTRLSGEAVLVPAPGLLVECFDDGAVIWDGRTERLHRFDPVGSAVWSWLDGARSVAEVWAALALDFDVAPEVVQRDVEGFLGHLLAQELVRERPGGRG